MGDFKPMAKKITPFYLKKIKGLKKQDERKMAMVFCFHYLTYNYL